MDPMPTASRTATADISASEPDSYIPASKFGKLMKDVVAHGGCENVTRTQKTEISTSDNHVEEEITWPDGDHAGGIVAPSSNATVDAMVVDGNKRRPFSPPVAATAIGMREPVAATKMSTSPERLVVSSLNSAQEASEQEKEKVEEEEEEKHGNKSTSAAVIPTAATAEIAAGKAEVLDERNNSAVAQAAPVDAGGAANKERLGISKSTSSAEPTVAITTAEIAGKGVVLGEVAGEDQAGQYR